MNKGLLFFLYSNGNIWGAVLGLLGLALLFLGVIEKFWYAIIPGLYFLGLLAAPSNRTVLLELNREQDVAALEAELKRLLRHIKRKVPKTIFDKVQSISESITALLPMVIDMQGDPNAFAVRQTATEYLPQTLENYLALPPAFANFHPIKDGKTAKQLLDEQLDLLDKEMQHMVHDMSQRDAQKMLVHGRFLESTFAKSESFF